MRDKKLSKKLLKGWRLICFDRGAMSLSEKCNLYKSLWLSSFLLRIERTMFVHSKTTNWIDWEYSQINISPIYLNNWDIWGIFCMHSGYIFLMWGGQTEQWNKSQIIVLVSCTQHVRVPNGLDFQSTVAWQASS